MFLVFFLSKTVCSWQWEDFLVPSKYYIIVTDTQTVQLFAKNKFSSSLHRFPVQEKKNLRPFPVVWLGHTGDLDPALPLRVAAEVHDPPLLVINILQKII